MGKRMIIALMVLALLPAVAAAEVESTPPYTVMVALSYEAPFVADGRSSFAEFAFSVTFRNVRFHYDSERPLPMLGYRIDGAKGKGTLTRHALNKVETGFGTVTPRVTKEPRQEFEAWLKITPGPFRDKWLEGKEPIVIPMPLQFITSWGMDMMKWDYRDGHSYLEEEGIEVFLVDFAALSLGEPITLEFPYQGGDPEYKGSWWIEFIPEKK